MASTISVLVSIVVSWPSLARQSSLTSAAIIISSSLELTSALICICLIHLTRLWVLNVTVLSLYFDITTLNELHAEERLPFEASNPQVRTSWFELLRTLWKNLTNLLWIWSSTGKSLQIKCEKFQWVVFGIFQTKRIAFRHAVKRCLFPYKKGPITGIHICNTIWTVYI